MTQKRIHVVVMPKKISQMTAAEKLQFLSQIGKLMNQTKSKPDQKKLN